MFFPPTERLTFFSIVNMFVSRLNSRKSTTNAGKSPRWEVTQYVAAVMSSGNLIVAIPNGLLFLSTLKFHSNLFLLLGASLTVSQKAVELNGFPFDGA